MKSDSPWSSSDSLPSTKPEAATLDKKGCPWCEKGHGSFYHSGMDIGPSYFMKAGYDSLVYLKNEFQWADEEVVRCHRCSSIWYLDYTFPDQPPLILDGDLIGANALPEFITRMRLKMAFRLQEKRLSQEEFDEFSQNLDDLL